MVFAKAKERKIKKYQNILKRCYNVNIVEDVSETIAVCNGGLANGLSQELLLLSLKEYGAIATIFQPVGQTVSFVKFQSVESAILAVQSETPFSWDGGAPAFLAFVDRTPDSNNDFDLSSPDGLIVLEDFITELEEINFLKCISLEPQSSLKHRKVKHFGFEFRYSDNRADSNPIEEIPEGFSVLWPRLLEKTGICFNPDQCTVNRYEPGDGIPPHVDTHSAFTEIIVSLSMQSDIVMDWRRGNETKHVLLPRRSLCLMTNESRYGWTHGITPRKSDVVPSSNTGLTVMPRTTRTSITFRKKREGDCNCSYKNLCDTAGWNLKNSTTSVTDSNAANFENSSVHEVYEKIADHFSETRHKPWPNVVQFLCSFPPGSVIVDVGCGNGKYLASGKNVALLGCDRSETLAKVTQDRGHNVFIADCLSIPIRDGSVDGCISIAVLHHLCTEERRLRGMKEMIRILRPGGRALIYVWAKNQETNSVKSNYLKQKKIDDPSAIKTEPTLACVDDVVLPVHKNRTNFQSSDMFVPWQKKAAAGTEGPTFLRYYHVFDDQELRAACDKIDNTKCLDYYYDQGNWCIILEKTK